MMMLASLMQQAVGDTTTDRFVIAATWIGLFALAAVVLIAAATSSRVRR
jgi:hypothetical protein